MSGRNCCFFFVCLIVFGWNASADLVFYQTKNSINESFPEGTGGQYSLRTGLGSAEVSMYVTNSNDGEVSVEILFRQRNNMKTISMWQQFRLVRQMGNKMKLEDGYLLVNEKYGPEKIPKGKLKGEGPFSMKDFQMLTPEELAARKTEKRTLQFEFGPLETTYTRMEKQGVVIEYWLSDKIKPFGIAKLKSSGPKARDNYEMNFKTLIKGVDPIIQPTKAKPLSKEGRKVLGLEPLTGD